MSATRRVLVVRAGWGTTVQDRGRPGMAHLGVPRSGPIDPEAAAFALRLVGAAAGTALFETLGGLEIEAHAPMIVASTVASAPVVLAAGERFEVPHSDDRNYHYLAIDGGLDVPAVLGSASHDTLSGLGPPPVRDGASYRLGPAATSSPSLDVAPSRPPNVTIRVRPGPRLDRFAEGTFERLCSSRWRPSDQASRVGVRLRGPELERRDRIELHSEGLVLGAVQVPHDGAPVVMLADHPTTGGYPVVAVVEYHDVAAVAQCPPGNELRFVPVPT